MSTKSKVFDWSHHKRTENSIAQGALTNSKRTESLVKGVYPTHLKKGLGCHVWDMSGNKYVDYISGLGTNLLGYSNTEVVRAAYEQDLFGSLLSLPTPIEYEAAEKVKELFPFVDQVRFLKTGTESCMAALRIARAKTGKQGVLSAGYHGWSDEFVSLTPPAHGIPRNFDSIGILDHLDCDLEDIAAVIIEPIVTDLSKARIEWLHKLMDRCKKMGTLVIFDEIITGFRFPKYSVSSYLGIEPDLICLGKAIANGKPLSVVAGKKEIMNGPYFVSSTFAGDMSSLAAALKTMTLLQTKYDLSELWQQGQRFLDHFNALYPGVLGIQGYPTRGVFVGDPLTKTLFWQEAVKAGILFGPSWFFNFCHPEQSDLVLSTCQDIVRRLKTSEIKLEGAMPESPFSNQIRRIP